MNATSGARTVSGFEASLNPTSVNTTRGGDRAGAPQQEDKPRDVSPGRDHPASPAVPIVVRDPEFSADEEGLRHTVTASDDFSIVNATPMPSRLLWNSESRLFAPRGTCSVTRGAAVRKPENQKTNRPFERANSSGAEETFESPHDHPPKSRPGEPLWATASRHAHSQSGLTLERPAFPLTSVGGRSHTPRR